MSNSIINKLLVFKLFYSQKFANFFKHPMVTSIGGAIVGALVTYWLVSPCPEPFETCWKIQNNGVRYFYKEAFYDPVFDKWYGCHLMADCFSNPKQLAEFLKNSSTNNEDIENYIENLTSGEQSVSTWNAIAIFQEAYWRLVKEDHIQIEGDSDKCIQISLSRIENEIINQLNKKYLEIPKMKILINSCIVKIDPFIAGDNAKLLKKIKNAINEILPNYICFLEAGHPTNSQFHISLEVTEFKIENTIIPQLKFKFYEYDQQTNSDFLPIPIVRTDKSVKNIFIQNAFRAFSGKLLQENIFK